MIRILFLYCLSLYSSYSLSQNINFYILDLENSKSKSINLSLYESHKKLILDSLNENTTDTFILLIVEQEVSHLQFGKINIEQLLGEASDFPALSHNPYWDEQLDFLIKHKEFNIIIEECLESQDLLNMYFLTNEYSEGLRSTLVADFLKKIVLVYDIYNSRISLETFNSILYSIPNGADNPIINNLNYDITK